MTDPVYEVVAAFAARLAALGVTDAVISPGSRSTPLTLCLDAEPGLRTWIQLDERSGGFFALGLGRATGRPAVLVCTSGTAAANYLPAVVEASHAGVPMIVCTADRPPELRGWGSPQTIDQVGLYGTAVRWSIDLPVPSEASAEAPNGWAQTTVDRALGPEPGPVHLNWPLREPLEPQLATAPAHRGQRGEKSEQQHSSASSVPSEPAASQEPWASSARAELAELARIVAANAKGVVVVGPWPGGGLRREQHWAAAARRFAAWAGWPLIGEPITQVRGHDLSGLPADAGSAEDASPCADARSCVVATADHLLADVGIAEELRPDAAVLVGGTVTTKPVRLWLERTRPDHVVVIDPENRSGRAVFRLTGRVPAPAEALTSFVSERAASAELLSERGVDPATGAAEPAESRHHPLDRAAHGGWLDTWRRLDAEARAAVAGAVDGGPMLSARTARALAAALAPNSVLVASNSMPVRDLDAFVFDTGSLVCWTNRGAAGIDGTASTALGAAAAHPSKSVALYTGDLALLHDLGGLAAAARLGLHLIAVCVDNDGGEIFSLLPVADRVAADDFERLFRTPHGLDLCGLDGFAGIRARRVASAAELAETVASAAAARTPGVDLLIVQVPRDDDVAQRRAVTFAAQQAALRVLAESL